MHVRSLIGALAHVTCLCSTVVGQERELRQVALITAAGGGLNETKILDVAVGIDGRIAVLFSDQVLKVWQVSDSATIAGRGAMVGALLDATKLAYGPGNALYVFDRKLNAISVFGQDGVFARRATVPLGLIGVRDLSVDKLGNVYISGSADRFAGGQVHVFCPRIDCYEYSVGSPRQTRDSVAFEYFQSGSIAVSETTIYLAHINPFWIEAIDLESHEARTLAQSGELDDAETVAFSRDGKNMSFSTRFPQITGIMLGARGQLFVSAFVPGPTGSFIAAHAARGHRLWQVRDPGYLAIKGQMPNGDLVVLRQFGPQQVLRYRVGPG